MSSNAQGAPLPGGAGHEAIARPVAEKPITRNERMVYNELCAAGAPMKAYALLERLHDEGLRAPMTIYRALDALIERGLAKRVASLNAFVAVHDGARQSVGAFVTCRRCGRTREIGLSEHMVASLLAPAGMLIDDVFIEAYGDCQSADCTRV